MQGEAIVRLGVFCGLLIVVAVFEELAPRRVLTESKVRRWRSNLGIVFLNTLLARMLLPATGVGMAALVHGKQWGLLNSMNAPAWPAVVVSVLLLDMAIYFQHVMFHAVPLFWRVHRMHHTDLDFDVTTGNRFHPLEILLSMLIKYAVIIVIGAHPLGVLVFEVALNGTAMFNHSNVRIPITFDRILRWFVVTPDMHRVHHSVEPAETNSNFGFNLPWWDRLFGTYRAQPRKGHEKMIIGLQTFRDPQPCLSLRGMLGLPFRISGTDIV